MSKFDYMNFEGGMATEFVVHAKKFTEEQAVELCIAENDWQFGESDYRKPTIEDVIKRQVKYFIRVPYYCGLDTDGGCYTFCNEDAKGSFPVWVIEFDGLKNF